MNQIKIRPPQEVEYTIVNKIICEAFNIQSNSHHPEFFSNPNIHCIVAVLNDVVIGTSSLHIIQKSSRKMGLIEDVVVTPKAQAKGVGKLMIKEIIQKAVELGCYKTILNTSEENAGFYSKLGFNKEQFQFTFRH